MDKVANDSSIAKQEPQPADAAQKPTRRQRVLMSVVCFFVFLAVYVLSVGPMAGLHQVFEFKQFQGSLEVIYAPLIALIEADVEPFASALKWYVGIFR